MRKKKQCVELGKAVPCKRNRKVKSSQVINSLSHAINRKSSVHEKEIEREEKLKREREAKV